MFERHADLSCLYRAAQTEVRPGSINSSLDSHFLIPFSFAGSNHVFFLLLVFFLNHHFIQPTLLCHVLASAAEPDFKMGRLYDPCSPAHPSSAQHHDILWPATADALLRRNGRTDGLRETYRAGQSNHGGLRHESPKKSSRTLALVGPLLLSLSTSVPNFFFFSSHAGEYFPS